MRHILVTGASSGIGLALCKTLVRDHGCHVYLGSRSVDKGQSCLNSILEEVPAAAGKIDTVQIDVTDSTSINACAEGLKAKGVTLYALVNNAGVGLAQANAPDSVKGILDTNLYGVKRVTEAMAHLMDPETGRIVNVSSGAASAWLKGQDAPTKALFSKVGLSFDELEAAVNLAVAQNNVGWGNGYGLSKAALTAFTLVQAAQYPSLTVVSLSPGFVNTPMTVGFNAKLTPEQGCLSSLKCLFEPVTSGFYYGSDGLRSPLTMTRDPGTPEYAGEDDPLQATYNK